MYKALNKQVFTNGDFSLVPIRFEDRYEIMKWRNEQIYHLRQNKPLTKEDQDAYFNNVVAKLFDQEKPNQILFSFLESGKCIGYGGLVHINWIDQNAEISFVINTMLESKRFKESWSIFLSLIERVAFKELGFHKIYTYAFDLRPKLFEVLNEEGYIEEARLKDHCFFNSKFIDVIINSKTQLISRQCKMPKPSLRNAKIKDCELLFNWVNDIDVRSNSFNQEFITWDGHKDWFKMKLKSTTTKILILELDKIPVGQIRIDFEGDYWVIDYSIQKDFRGKKLGKEIVKQLLKKCTNYKFKAIVKKGNIASAMVFEGLGFEEIKSNNHGTKLYIHDRSKKL
jgi:RimJ/RimL family protein N-acetyltransferase